MSCVERSATSILRFQRIGDEALEITGCWAPVLAPGARTHVGADTINFHDPRRQTGAIRPPVVELSAENTDQVVVRVGDGALLIFPSYLEHSVDANSSGEERFSVSFNLMFPRSPNGCVSRCGEARRRSSGSNTAARLMLAALGERARSGAN